jgi:hypothetical protein
MAHSCPWKPRPTDARWRRNFGRLLRVRALLEHWSEETRLARDPKPGAEGAAAESESVNVIFESRQP